MRRLWVLLVACAILVIGGGAAFAQAVPGDMSVVPGGNAPNPDIQIGGAPSVEETQDPEQGLTIQDRSKLAVWIIAVTFLMAIFSFFTRRFDWQRLPETETCKRCLSIHFNFGGFATLFDWCSLASLCYVSALPFFAAFHEDTISAPKVGMGILVTIAAVIALVGSGWMIRTTLRILPNGAPASTDLTASLMTGTRAVGFAVSAILLAGGTTIQACSSQINALFGTEIGQTLFEVVGVTPFRDTAVVLLTTILFSVSFRWIAPIALGSRPLVFLKSQTRIKTHALAP